MSMTSDRNPFDVILATAEMLSHPERIDEVRETAIQTVVDGITIDTCLACDTGKWETGIEDSPEHCVVVQDHEDYSSATEAPQKWVSEGEGQRERKFRDINLYNSRR